MRDAHEPCKESKTIFFDESGNTGVRLLDPHQRSFSVGSTDLTQEEALSVIKKCFPSRVGADIKFKGLVSNWRNFDGLLKPVEAIGTEPDRYFCFMVDKRFALLCRVVDWLVEPYFHHRGFDWYKDDYGRSYVNLFDLAFDIDRQEAVQFEIVNLFEQFAKSPDNQKLFEMQVRFRELARQDSRNVSRFMEHVADGADEFEKHWDIANFKDSTDIHVTSIVRSVAWWRSKHDQDFEVVHGESNHFFDRREMWDLLTDMSASGAEIHIGDKSIQFPLRVHSTIPGKSDYLFPLQVCDLICGFCTKSKSENLSKGQQELIQNMIEAGMGKLNFDSVQRDDHYASGDNILCWRAHQGSTDSAR